MPFEQPPIFQDPTKRVEYQEEEEAKRRRLRGIIEKIAERLQKEGVPVDKECRIDMNAFGEVYSEDKIKKDQKLVKDYEKDWYGDVSEKEIQEKRDKSTGEKLEKLKTAIFDKFLGDNFIVVRSSLYDDIKNKIDNVILEKETGNLVCAFDEVGDISGPRFEEKKRRVLERNTNRKEKGGKLKYGITLKNGELALGEAKNLPVFYLALPEKLIERGIENLSGPKEKTNFEKKLFEWFRSSLESQVKALKLEEGLNERLKERLLHFEEAIHRYHPSRDK